MGLRASCVIFIFAFAVMSPVKTSQLTDAVQEQRIINAPEKPSISDSFKVSVEGIFKDRNTGADGTLYFDRANNIAAMDMMWQNDFVRTVYSFDTNELISVKGYNCEVKEIPDDPSESFFPFTIDPQSKRKILGTSEEALYFKNSVYVQDDFHGDIESYMYQGYIDVPMYQRKNCSVTHYFSKPEFETAHCDNRFCKPVLLTILVYCAGVQEEEEGEIQMVGEVDHLYRFYNFMDTIQDENVFHPPPGVFCNRTSTKNFPHLPMYFSFSYDVMEDVVQVDNAGGLKILHKRVWYDGDLQLIRVDAFDEDGFLQATLIYDFYNEMDYSAFPQINETSRGVLNAGLSLHGITLLPEEVFPRRTQKPRSSPAFVGLRKVHGLEYHVWAVCSEMTDDPDYSSEVVTELYFQTVVSEKDGEVVKEAGQQLSFIEISTYISDDDDTELSQATFVPINNFRSASRDLSAFDLSIWFDNDEKRAFEIDVTGPALIVGTKFYTDILEQLYLEIVTLASIMLTRISKLEISYNDTTTNSTTFSGWILESPSNLGYNKQSNESDVNTTFSVLEKLTNDGGVEFTVADKYGVPHTFVMSSFRESRNKVEKPDRTYSGGAVAATALTMFMVGLAIGMIGITALRKKQTEKQKDINLVEKPSNSNNRISFNDFS